MADKISWKDVKAKLIKCSERDLIELISDLYDLDSKNKRFLQARFNADREIDLEKYKYIIWKNVHPNFNKSICLSKGRKAISEYKKATGNIEGILDLMIYYVESGTKFSLEYGDIDEPFYNSMESMFAAAIKLLKTCDESTIELFIHRLRKIVRDTQNMGWGYHDYLSETLNEAFPI